MKALTSSQLYVQARDTAGGREVDCGHGPVADGAALGRSLAAARLDARCLHRDMAGMCVDQ